jgi:1,2-dihydroxy-3-keto-5-methylthiopentene dioxygenase
MTVLHIFDDQAPYRSEVRLDEIEPIRDRLASIDVLLERWDTSAPLGDDATHEQIIAAYRSPIDRLKGRFDFKSIDVIGIASDHPQKASLRDKFLHEHTHDDFEVRVFVRGEGAFYIRRAGKVYATLCTRGDFISVPANTTHWFDMGEHPQFTAIRLFTTPEGWVAKFTGDTIADRLPRLDALR